MSINRDRKEASKRLGIALHQRYNALVTAGNNPEDVQHAAIELGVCFNENIEFIIYVLKTHGGLDVPAPERPKRPASVTLGAPPPTPAFIGLDLASGQDND